MRTLLASLLVAFTLCAEAKPKTATIIVLADPGMGGAVAGGGIYHVGATVTITEKPATGFTFVSWQDGSTAVTRTIAVTSGGSTWTASFTNPPAPIVLTTNLSFGWNQVAGSADYHLHYGPASGTYTNVVVATATNVSVTLPRGATLYFAVDDTSASSGLTSLTSSEIVVTVP